MKTRNLLFTAMDENRGKEWNIALYEVPLYQMSGVLNRLLKSILPRTVMRKPSGNECL
jgi:hypothetical protein